MGTRVGVLLLLLGVFSDLATTTVVTIHNSSGTIEAPPDPSGGAYYKPDARILWVLDMQDSDINIELNLDKVDLGLPYTTIHDESKVNYTEGDFLLIGAGRDTMNGDEVMFYGWREDVPKVTILGGVGHVYFYSSKSVRNATGFTINYNSIAKPSTTPPPTTTTPPPDLSSTIVSIQGIPASQWYFYNDSFTEAISRMASDYPQPEFNMSAVPVNTSDVIINAAKTCDPNICPLDYCVAYDFSLATLVDGVVVFDQWEMNDMVADPSANTYIEEMYGPECQICDENRDRSIVAYTVIPILIVVFGVAFAYAAYKFTGRSSLSRSQEQYEKTAAERMDDQRRRSSGDISILGIGGKSIAWQGSLSSRRFTMPYPKEKRDGESDIEEGTDQDAVDGSDYTYYDPDIGITNPAQYGMPGAPPQPSSRPPVATGFTQQGQAVHGHTNQAFVMDEESAVELQRASFADDTDSSDSENGGAISFRPRRRTLTPTNKIEVPADVHSEDVEEETSF